MGQSEFLGFAETGSSSLFNLHSYFFLLVLQIPAHVHCPCALTADHCWGMSYARLLTELTPIVWPWISNGHLTVWDTSNISPLGSHFSTLRDESLTSSPLFSLTLPWFHLTVHGEDRHHHVNLSPCLIPNSNKALVSTATSPAFPWVCPWSYGSSITSPFIFSLTLLLKPYFASSISPFLAGLFPSANMP